MGALRAPRRECDYNVDHVEEETSPGAAHIIHIGNSQGVRIPKALLEESGLTR